MNSICLRARTALDLGILNVLKVATYRLGLRLGIHPVLRLKSKVEGVERFESGASPEQFDETDEWIGIRLFGVHPVRLSLREFDWHRNHLNSESVFDGNRPWWAIPEFGQRFGDVKVIWEPSRFNWVLPLAQAIRADRDGVSRPGRSDFSFGFGCDPAKALDGFLASWIRANPPYIGVNWKCGQEASIRVLNLLLALEILGEFETSRPKLAAFIQAHLERIRPTVSYALAQQNNHGTSEAAALYIGGHYLEIQRYKKSDSAGFVKLGWKLLSSCMQRLVLPDGTFSQYSTNYQRMVVDTLSLTQFFRRRYRWSETSPSFETQARRAIEWLGAMVDPLSGDAFNLGANDGSQIVQVHDADYRDFRPSLAFAEEIFGSEDSQVVERCLEFFRGRKMLTWKPKDGPKARIFQDGGLLLASHSKSRGLLRAPKFKFRPSQSDVLHVDWWAQGRNVLLDSGTFSYNSGPADLDYFGGAKGHNTIEFDGRSQMPRLSRFLFGHWLQGEAARDQASDTLVASYRDWKGVWHRRQTRFQETSLTVVDSFDGPFRSAVMRWHLPEGDYRLDGQKLTGNGISIVIRSNLQILRIELIPAFVSRYYLHRQPIRCLEIEFDRPGQVETEIGLT